MNVVGLIAIIVFYVLILGVGLWAAYKRKDVEGGPEETMLAGRSIGSFVGILTMTATWVGGGYINGSAEAIYSSGLLFCQAPFGYAISLSLGGLFFAKKMRDAQYITMLDPLQDVFGKRWGAMLYLPALAGETLWSASILGALGSTLSVILKLTDEWSIIVSAAIAVTYTLFGGLYAVAYTDVLQLFCIFIGLWISVPFSIMNENVGSLAINETNWLGSSPENWWEWGEWVDYAILLICGGIPWQVYFQRVLSSQTSRQAQLLSFSASFGCILMAVPACIIGAIAKATDWQNTDYGKEIGDDQAKNVLPLVLQYLTPPVITFFGLGAVSAAVMSSADSSVLSASSMFTNNIYKNVFRPRASNREMSWVMRVSIVVVAVAATVIAIESKSVYDLFHLCGDLVYVMLFPQLTFAVHGPKLVNTYGSIAAFIIGFLLRILGGEKLINLPAVIEYPWYKDEHQWFPFRTLAMIVTLVTLPLVSWITKTLITREMIPRRCDFLGVFEEKEPFPKTTKSDKGYDNPALDHKDGSRAKPLEMTNF